jgi:cyclin T
VLLKLDNVIQKYLEQAQDLVFNENVLLQTLGFDVAIDHPHTHVVRCCHLVRGKCLAVTTARRRYMQAAEVYLTRALENLNYTVGVVNIIMWHYLQNMFFYA